MTRVLGHAILALMAHVALAQADEVEWSIAPERLEDEADEHWPIPVDLSGIEVQKEIVFARPGREQITLDLYRPKERGTEPLPCVVAIHGGGWRVNTKEWFTPHAVYLARAGFVAVTINYRKRPQHAVQACLDDAKAAIVWVRAHAAELGIDPSKVGALGGSAGGHLVAVLAVTSDKDCRVNAAVGFATADLGHAGLDSYLAELDLNQEQARELGAYAHVTKDAAPLLLVHGTADDTVPVAVSQDLHKRYQQVGAYSELKLLSGYHHVFYVTPKTFFEAMGYATRFFGEHLGKPR